MPAELSNVLPGSPMALEVIYGTTIPRELATPTMEYLWVKWRTLKATNQLDLERLTERSRHYLRQNLAYLISSGDSFAYLYVGDDVVGSHGNAKSGNLVTEISGPRAADFLQVYRKAASTMTPAFVRFTGETLASGQTWLRIVLPIQLTADTVLLVCYSEVASHQIEVYEHLFRTAPDAILVACAICNDAGHAIDGWVTMMNDRARAMLGYSGSLANLRLSEVPQFASIDLWGRLHAPRPGNSPQILKTARFDLEVLRFPHAFGLRIHAKSVTDVNETIPLAPHGAAGDRERV